MGRVAEELADSVVLTSDNPRSESPAAIIDEILAGLRSTEGVHVEADRRRAITGAIAEASAGETVLVAGKGHETYQEIAGVRHPFDDRQVAREALRARSGRQRGGQQ